MKNEDQTKFFSQFAANFRRIHEEARPAWASWLSRNDVTYEAAYNAMSKFPGGRRFEDTPSLKQFQARYIAMRGTFKGQSKGCEKCEFTGWQHVIYSGPARWNLDHYDGVVKEDREWGNIWPMTIVDPRDRADSCIWPYYRICGMPCTCDYGLAILNREINDGRPPCGREQHRAILTQYAMAPTPAHQALKELIALSEAKYTEADREVVDYKLFGNVGNALTTT